MGLPPDVAEMPVASAAGAKPRLMFLVTEDWYFVSHRLGLAVAAMKAGFDVSIATRVERHGAIIERSGLQLFPIAFDRLGLRPRQEARTILAIGNAYREFRPDIVHQVALKPIIYGSLAARLCRIPAIVNALGGLGYVFKSGSGRAQFVRRLLKPALRIALHQRRSRFIVQNSDDQSLVLQMGMAPADAIRLIRGAGVDPSQYRQAESERQPPLVILPARLLRDKGILEFVAAARKLREDGISARFALVGKPDLMNPASLTQEELDDLCRDGVVENWGWQDDMPAVLAQTQIVCLPTFYGEGLPKSLLEAAASCCAIVTTDIPGCRDIVRHGATGLLVPPRDIPALVDALRRLIENPSLRAEYGAAARALVEAEFSAKLVFDKTIEIYSELLGLAGTRH
jgi:glycosyltransferase involved in cell wall biosynthesis